MLDHPEEAVRTADDLEAFFNVTLYTALRYMRHNCNNLQMTMYDYFDGYKYDSEKHRYICGIDKRMAMSHGWLHDAAKDRYYFLDDNGPPKNHPLNKIITVMLKWFNERYAHLDASKTNATDVVPKLALDNHVALLRLLDSKLDDPAPDQKVTLWPKHDKVGDQLKAAKKQRSSGDEEKPRVKRVKTIQSGKASARASSSARASGSPSPAVSRAPVRTRGGRLTRGSAARSKIIR